MRIRMRTCSWLEKWIGLSDGRYFPIPAKEEFHKIHCHLLPGRPAVPDQEWEWDVPVSQAIAILDNMKRLRGEHRDAFARRKGVGDLYDSEELGWAIKDLQAQIKEATSVASEGS
jgi:hypothetical protein